MSDPQITFHAYILQNPYGKYYIGHTDNLDRRLAEHNADEKIGTKYTHKNGPWTLVWSEAHPTRAAAMQRERDIKRKKSAKWSRENLLERQSESPLRRHEPPGSRFKRRIPRCFQFSAPFPPLPL
ncbi:MAG: GIY-YIG nuclease family protein [Phycisphaerae bacterium]